MSILSVISLIGRIVADPTVQAGVAKFLEFLNSLTDTQRASYLSKFTSPGGYGAALGECPDCPDECVHVEEALLAAVAGGDSVG